MFPPLRAPHSISALFNSLPSVAMPGLHSEGLKLRPLFLHFEQPGRILKLKQAYVNLTQCMGQPPNMNRIGFRPGSNKCVDSVDSRFVWYVCIIHKRIHYMLLL